MVTMRVSEVALFYINSPKPIPDTGMGVGESSMKSLLCLAKRTVRRNLVRQKHSYNTYKQALTRAV